MDTRGSPTPQGGNLLFLALIILISLALLLGAAWLGGILLALTLAGALFLLLFYSAHYIAPDDAIGIVYWCYKDRLFYAHAVAPRQSTFIIPFVQKVKEIHTRTRTMDISVDNVLTADKGPIRCRITVIYRVHAHKAHPPYRWELAHFTDEQWGVVVHKAGNAALRSAINALSFKQIFGPHGDELLAGETRARLARYVTPRGIEIIGVIVQDKRPGGNVETIVHEQFMAPIAGEAVLDRLRPVLETLWARDGDLRNILLALLLAGQGLDVNMPNFFVSLGNDQAYEQLWQLLRWYLSGFGHGPRDGASRSNPRRPRSGPGVGAHDQTS